MIKLVRSYNQKIIETPTYIEVWEYEQPIYLNQKKSIQTEKELPEWLEGQVERKKFDELSAQGQYDSLKRKQKHYQNKRFEIARIIDTNFDKQTKFLTLTFKENVTDIDYTNSEFKKFIKRLNYQLYKTKKSQIHYIATWEKQKRGAIHYHIILFNFPYIPHQKLFELWGHGAVRINKIDVDSIENRGRYVSKYFDKDLELKEHKQKSYFKSQNLRLPKERKKRTDKPYDFKNKQVLFTKEYTQKKPVFTGHNGLKTDNSSQIDFEESIVRYTKIKK